MNETLDKMQMGDADYASLLQADKIIFTFPVLWHEWECDGTAWIMEKPDGTRYLKMSNHGGVYVADPEQLIERLVFYESVAVKTKTALAYLQGL